jgi:hypothetical protein
VLPYEGKTKVVTNFIEGEMKKGETGGRGQSNCTSSLESRGEESVVGGQSTKTGMKLGQDNWKGQGKE